MSGLVMKYFVLSPTKQDEFGSASRDAILTFARTIEGTNPVLAKELREWVEQLDLERPIAGEEK